MKKFGIVLLTKGVFGGAERRFTLLYRFLNTKSPGCILFFVSDSLKKSIAHLYPTLDLSNVVVLGPSESSSNNKSHNHQALKKNKNRRPFQSNFLIQVYRFFKNRNLQHHYYNELNSYVNEHKIASLLGVYSGILPMYFYFSQKTRPGIIFSNMDSWFSNLSENPKKDWHKKYSLFNLAHTKSDIVDFLSPFILEGVKQRGISVPEKKVRITACSFTDLSRCKLGDKSKFNFVFAARLEEDKNPLLYLEAALILAKEFPDAEFHLMGEGRLRETIKNRINEARMSNVIFHGFHTNPTDVFADSSVFVSIQTTNNYPSQSVLEAMACGNAIIASDVGDTRMFVNKDNGSLISLDLESLTTAMRAYLSTPNLAQEQGSFAVQYVKEHFSIERAAEYYLQLFEEVATINKKR